MSTTEPRVHLKLLEAALTSEHLPSIIGGKQTHDGALRYVGQLVQHATDTDLIQAIVGGALPPNYSGDTLHEVPGMVASAIDKGFHLHEGGSDKKRKKTDAEKIVEATM